MVRLCLPLDLISIEIAESKPSTSLQEVLDALDKAIENREEGVMVKRLDSPYLPDKRQHWIKLKPEYLEGVGDDLDLLILGGFYGEGARRGGKISHFLLGLKKDDVYGDSGVDV